MSEGIKNDAGKPRLDLMSGPALFELGKVLEIGARKYGDRNWEKGLKWGRVFGALMRHAWKFWMGERHDNEDGQHHLASVMWCAMVLLHYDLHSQFSGNDDRSL
jgi:hypothetical protein